MSVTTKGAPLTGWKRWVPFKGIMRQRWQVLFLIRKEFLAPHRRSVLGLFWSIVLPIIPITAYIILRGVVAGQRGEDGIHPMAYVTIGVALWLLFRDMVRTPVDAVRRYASTIANTELSVGGAILVGFGGILLDTLLRIAVCIPIIYLTHPDFSLNFFGMMGWLIAGIGFFFACGLMSVPLTALFPDLRNIYDTIFSYLIFFSLAIFPFAPDSRLGTYISYNPFAMFIDAIRVNLINGHTPDGSLVGWASLAGFVLLIISVFVIRRVGPQLKEAYL